MNSCVDFHAGIFFDSEPGGKGEPASGIAAGYSIFPETGDLAHAWVNHVRKARLFRFCLHLTHGQPINLTAWVSPA